ncbi:hypothetical protein LZ30DRAFT_325975 [Colletotrichum cereale]|nr:hypothetical protein LZ30DRAFT_325975 [Colletotrichum cereale]
MITTNGNTHTHMVYCRYVRDFAVLGREPPPSPHFSIPTSRCPCRAARPPRQPVIGHQVAEADSSQAGRAAPMCTHLGRWPARNLPFFTRCGSQAPGLLSSSPPLPATTYHQRCSVQPAVLAHCEPWRPENGPGGGASSTSAPTSLSRSVMGTPLSP